MKHALAALLLAFSTALHASAEALTPPAASATTASRGPASSDPGPMVLSTTAERGEKLLAQVRQHTRVGGAMVVGLADHVDPTPDMVNVALENVTGNGVRMIILDGELVSGSVEATVRRLKARGVSIHIAILGD